MNDLADLLNQTLNLSNTNLDNNLDSNLENNLDSNMTTPVNYQLLRLYIDTIPMYDGNPHTLSIFIDSCTHLMTQFPDPNLRGFLKRAIFSKLTGRALTLIGSRIELNSWEQVRDILLISFGDQRNIECLVQDLINLKPNKNETPHNFGMRCQDARSLIISKLNSNTSICAEEKAFEIKNYNDLALKTFIRGLQNPIQTNVRLRNPENLEKAMSLLIEEENFLYSSQKSNTLNTQPNFRPNNRSLNDTFPNFKPIVNTHSSQTNNTFRPVQQNPFYRQNERHYIRPQQFQRPQLFQIPQQPQRPQQFQRPFNPNPFPNQFPIRQHQSTMRPNNNQNFTRPVNNNFKPEPMECESIRSRRSLKPNKLFLQDVYNAEYENFDDQFDQYYQLESDENYYDEACSSSQYYIPQNDESIEYFNDQVTEAPTTSDNNQNFPKTCIIKEIT